MYKIKELFKEIVDFQNEQNIKRKLLNQQQ